MGYNYPWTNIHELNLDWLIDEVMKIKDGDWTPANFQIANVRDYGAVGDGATDDTAAFIDAIGSGLPVYVPAGQYLITSLLTITGPGMFGAGHDSVIDLYGPGGIASTKWYVTVENLAINTNDKTSGYALSLTGAYSHIRNINLTGSSAADGIYIGGPSSTLEGSHIENAAIGVTVQGADTSINICNCIIRKITGVPTTGTGILVENGNAALSIIDTAVLLYEYAVHTLGTVYSLRISNGWLDSCTQGLYISGKAYDTALTNVWISVDQHSIWAEEANGLLIYGCTIWSDRATTFALNGTLIKALTISATVICCAYGINLDTGRLIHAVINSCMFGTYRGWSDKGHYAIWLNNNTNDKILISNNDLSGYAAQLGGSQVGVTAVNNLS